MKKQNKLMRFISFCLMALSLMLAAGVRAQSNKLPPFRMLQADGKIFKAEQLPIGKPIILIYFSPECDHCEKLMKEFFKKPALFNKASITFITFLPVDRVARFEKNYGVRKYANMYSGTEGSSFFVKNYYKLTEMPFVALYSRNGDFIKSYTREVALKDLVQKLNALK